MVRPVRKIANDYDRKQVQRSSAHWGMEFNFQGAKGDLSTNFKLLTNKKKVIARQIEVLNMNGRKSAP